MVRLAAALLVLSVAAVGAAHAFELGLPLPCTPGKDCWVVNYVDIDPGPAARDGACGARTYDGHDGTDFAIRDMKAMAEGIAVRAAAAGTVKAVRDGARDVDVNAIGRESVKGKECGNGVVLDHGQGWETQYCHMRQGSLAVKRGDRVAEGQALGLVGLSGLTEFPHVHLTVRHHGKPLDPFTGREQDGTCGAGPGGSLWRGELKDALVYEPVVLFDAGIVEIEPTRDALMRGEHRRVPLTAGAPMLVLWVEAFGVEAGDEIRLRLKAPDGRMLVDTTRTMAARRAYQYVYSGLRRPGEAWPAGRYQGEIVLTRKGAALERRMETEAEVR